jgi:predicted SAM-dependent methyltransferase
MTHTAVNLPRTAQGLVCLNAGCGRHFRADWVNLDSSSTPGVQECDLQEGVPYPDATFDVVYSSHVLEHFSKTDGAAFIRELFRVLKPGETIRLATPDLERLAQEYLQNLKAWSNGRSEINRRRYEWILLELFDQMTREKSGGEMLKKLRSGDIDRAYVQERTGDELAPWLSPALNGSRLAPKHKNIFQRLERRFKRYLKEWLHQPEEMLPDQTGELHRWYYDRLSLEHLLSGAGFTGFIVVDFKTSRIPGWPDMNLDKSQNMDAPRKPDSIFVEAVKPESKA